MVLTSRARSAAVLAILLLVVVGCGGDADSSGEVDTGDVDATDVATFAVAGPASEQVLEDLQSIIAARLRGLDVAEFEIDIGDPGHVVVSISAGGSLDASEAFALLDDVGELRFRPVITTTPGPIDGVVLTPPDQDLADQPVTLAAQDQDGIIATYQLGPAGATGAIVSGAEAVLGHDTWSVSLEITAEGIDQFNAIAEECNAQSESCPTGQLAIVLDSEVITAPSISQPAYNRDEIQISGVFDEDEARDLALVLRAGALPVRIVLESITETGG